MTAKKYLDEIRGLKNRLNIYKAIADNYHIDYESMVGIDYSRDRVQTSPKNTLELAAWKMLEQEEKAMKEVSHINAELNKRLRMIAEIDKPTYSQVLFMRFYQCKEPDQIAKEIGKKRGTVLNLQKEAIDAFDEKYFKKVAEK